MDNPELFRKNNFNAIGVAGAAVFLFLYFFRRDMNL